MTVAAVHSGGLILTGQDLTGAADQGDPWTLALTMTALGIVSLTDPGGDDQPLPSPPPANLAAHGFATGAWFAVTILNDSGVTWTSFDIYPERLPGQPSPDGDGLSFAQLDPIIQWCSSDKFPSCVQTDVPDDSLHCSGGLGVADGESVTFFFPLTDNAPASPIYLEFVPNSEALPLVIACGSPPRGFVGRAYSHVVPTAGGVEPYTFSITAGALPTGLTLNAATGTIEGVPTATGRYTFTIEVEDSAAETASVDCCIFIAPPRIGGL